MGKYLALGQDVWTSSQIFSLPALPLNKYIALTSEGLINKGFIMWLLEILLLFIVTF